MLGASSVQSSDDLACDNVLSPLCGKYPLSQEVLDFVAKQKVTVSSQAEVTEPLVDISVSNDALLRELEEDLNSLASKKNKPVERAM